MATPAFSITLQGINKISRKVELLRRSIFSKALMTDVGLFITTRIKQRTSEGKDVSGRSFKPYSPKYKMFRQKHGHPTDKVNLTYTGSMLSSMTFDADASDVEVYFLNTNDEKGGSNPKKAFFLNEQREFFALSKGDVAKIVQMVNGYYRRLIAS